jgi:hypothetical protein
MPKDTDPKRTILTESFVELPQVVYFRFTKNASSSRNSCGVTPQAAQNAIHSITSKRRCPLKMSLTVDWLNFIFLDNTSCERPASLRMRPYTFTKHS